MGLENYVSIRSYITDNRLGSFLKKDASFNGTSEFTDHVLRTKGPRSRDTDRDLMWCREIHTSCWPSMKTGKFYPFHKKNIRFKAGVQHFDMPVGTRLIECNNLNEAKKHFKKDLDVWFSFKRTSKDYKYGDISIYIEDVEHIGLSVDIVCRKGSNSLKENTKLVTGFMKEHGVTKIIPHQVATLVAKALKKAD